MKTQAIGILALFLSPVAFAQLNSGSYTGDDNYQGNCQLQVSPAGGGDGYNARTGYITPSFLLEPTDELVNGQKRIRKNEYGAKIMKESVDPSTTNPVKYSLLVKTDDSGKPLQYFYFDNTDDGPRFKRRQFTCTLKSFSVGRRAPDSGRAPADTARDTR